MKCKKFFALLLSLCMIASSFVAMPISAATENVIDIDLPLDDVSELTWVASSSVTVSNADGIGGRDDVILASGLANSNNNTVGVKLPDGFAFAEGDVFTYSLDVYSETAINPDVWLRNHDGSNLNPVATFYHDVLTASTWTTITKTLTYEEMVAASTAMNSSGAWNTIGKYAFYLRPRSNANVYLDNLKITVARPVVERGTIVEIVVDDASDITWTNGGTAADADGIGGRDGVIALGNLANSNGNTAGVKLPDGFAFQEGDLLTYSADVYSNGTQPDLWLRDHSDLAPFVTFYHEISATDTWTTITKSITYEEMVSASTTQGSTGDFGTAGNFALYFRPRNATTIYVDNFTVTVERVDYTGSPIDPDHEHSYGDWEKNDADTHKKTCGCGDVVTEAHTWDAGVVTQAPTTEAEGVKTYTCTVCGETYTEAVDKLVPRANVVEIVVDDASDITWTNGGTAANANGIGGRDGVIELANLADANGNTAGVKLPDGFAFKAGDILTYSADVYANGTQPNLWLRDHSDLAPFVTFYHEISATDTWTTITKSVTYEEMVSASTTQGSTGDFGTAGNFALYFRPKNTTTIYVDNFTVTVSRALTGKPTIETVDYVSDEGNGVYKCTTAGIIAGNESSGAWSSQVRLRIIPEVPVSINDDLKVTFDFEANGILNSVGEPYGEMTVNLRLYDSVNGTTQANTIGYIKNAHVAANTGSPVTLEYYIADMENGGGSSTLTEVKSIGVQVDMYGACTRYQTEANDGYFTISNIQVGTGTKEDHEHSYGAWVEDGDNHKKSCSCGDVVTEAHTWDAGVVTQEPTTEAEGEKTYTCTVCSATKTEVLGKIEETVNRENVVEITADAASELTWIASSSVTATNANGIGGRDGVIMVSGLANSNNNTAGVKLPDGFAFQAGDILTYSVDVYSDSAINPDMWLRNHNGSVLNPMAVFYNAALTAGTWTTITKTVTYDELEAAITAANSSGTFSTSGNYALYIRPRSNATVYLDNFTVSVAREVVARGNVIDIEVNDASDITWLNGGTSTDANGIGGRDGVIALGNLANSNTNTAGVILADSFAFQEGDILTYSLDVYSTVAHPDLWLRNHGSSLSPFTTFYHEVTPNTWTTITKTVTYADLMAAGAFDAADKYALYLRPRESGTVYVDNFTVTVAREGYVASCKHEFSDCVTDGAENHKKTCSLCGEVVTESHTWNDGVVTVEPTYTTEGEKTYTCTACGETYTEVVDKLSYRENVINITVNSASDITWTNGGTATDANGIGGRDGVIALGNLANANGNTAGIVLADSFAFQAGDILTYSLDVYSDTVTNPDIWLRNHGSSLNPFTTFYHTVTTGTWTTITKTLTYDELTALVSGWETTGYYALYLRPRQSGTVYVDNFTVSVSRETEYRGKVIDITAPLNSSNELTWIASEAVTATDVDGIGGRDDVVKVEGLADSNSNTAGIKLPSSFAFQAGDIITYSVDVYADTAINPDIWLRNHGSALTPFKTFYHEALTANTWTTLTKTVTYDELGTDYDWTTTADYALYLRPRQSGTVYVDNFAVTVSRLNYTGDPIEPPHVHTYESEVTKAATCGADGEKTFTCTACGESYTEVIPATGVHAWGEGVETVPPTVDAEGVMTYTCTVCGTQKTEAIDKLPDPATLTTITVGNMTGVKPGDEIRVPLTISNNGLGMGLTGLEINVKFDKNVLSYVYTSKASAVEGDALLDLNLQLPGKNFTDGDIKFAWENSEPDSSDGVIIYIPFKVADTAAAGDYTIDLTVNAACSFDLEANKTLDVQTIAVDGIVSVEVEAHEHVYEEVVTKAPTCTEEGEKTFTCECEDSYTEVMPALGHNMSFNKQVDATCTEAGTKAHYVCSTCGKTYEDVAGEVELTDLVIPSLGHSYEEKVTVEPTCTEEGEKTFTCTVCGDTYTETIAALGHTMTFNKQIDATCTENGTLAHYACSVCGKTYEDEAGLVELTDLVIPSLGHAYESEVTKAPTCGEDGVKTFTCACGDTYTEVIPATGKHTYESEVNEPTCGEGGVETFTCTVCGHTYTIAIPATGKHTYESEVTKAPTCAEEGEKTFTCTVCGDSYIETIPATGNHLYGEGVVTVEPTCAEEGVMTYTCTVCGDQKTKAIPATGEHSYDEGVVTVEPTYTTTGIMTFTCTVCGHTYTEVLPKIGHTHDWGEGVVTTEPTHTQKGVMTYTCALCGETKEEMIPATGHEFGSWEAEDDEFHSITCSCNEVIREEHAWDAGVMTVKPTYTMEGSKKYTCLVCGHTKTVVVPKNVATEDDTNITVGNVTGRAGETVKVPVSISKNVGLTGLQLTFKYDTSALTLTSVERGAALADLEFDAPDDLSAETLTFVWENADADASNGDILYLNFQIADYATVGKHESIVDVTMACDDNLDETPIYITNGIVTVSEYEYGDVNEDDIIDVKDIILVRRYIVGGFGVELEEIAADVCLDGIVDIKDVVILRKFVIGGYNVQLPAPPAQAR